MSVHIHIGSNVPGYLPESDVLCVGDVDDAIEALRHELKDLQDWYYEECYTAAGLYGDSVPNSCECAWCDVATDVGAALSAVADGDAAYAMVRYGRVGRTFSPPEGPDVAYWAVELTSNRDRCELNEDD